MDETSQSLFEVVRQACFPSTWSRGVELTRADAVVGERAAADEAVFRVSTRGGMICPKVTLFPEELDWECECASREPACEHVAAAVIAWRRSHERGDELPAPRVATGRVGYRFLRQHGALALERVIVCGPDERRLEATLVALADGRVAGPKFVATQPDLVVELALGTHRRGPLAPAQIPRLFAVLSACSDVTLDGKPVRVSAEPVLPRGRLVEQGDGYRLVVQPDPSVAEEFSNGALRAGDVLCCAGDPRLTGRERHELGQGRYFGPEAVAELVTQVLPGLQRRIPVDVDTERLPRTTRERPRALVETVRCGHALSVLPTLVYGDPPLARVDGGRLVPLRGPVPIRDEKAERIELRKLERLGLVCGVRAEFLGAEAVAFRVRLAMWNGSISGRDHEFFALAPPLAVQFQVGPEDFDLRFEVGGNPGPSGAGGGAGRGADPASVIRAWKAGESLAPLREGGYAPLPADWLGRFGHRVAALLAAREVDGRLPRCCLPELARLCEELEAPVPPEMSRLRGLLAGFEGIPAASLPEDLVTELRPYQRRGVDWLVFLREAGLGAMLADDMGLGKTLQALCAMRVPALVVAPTSVLHNWVDEIERHRPGLSVSVYHGPARRLDEAADVTVTTYAILRLDVDRLSGRNWETVVLDEAQTIKNPASQVASAAFRLGGRFRVTLTGTPVENRLDELWSQFHFSNRGLLGGLGEFQETYAQPIGRGDAEVAARLRERIRPFLLRRLKREVATELPPRTEMVLRCELSESERQVYDAVRAATVDEVVRKLGEGGNVMAALEALLRLRQAACHPALIPGQSAPNSTKLQLLMEALDSVVAEGHKALVFSQWTSLLDLVEPHLESAGIRYLRLDGSTRDRGELVQRFQQEDEIPVFLISLKAGGTGLNLTSADHVFLLDPWWNPAVEDQAADRAHRIGQRRPVMIYRLVAEQTVEEKILVLQARKRELAQAVLEGAEQAQGLTRNDLLDLLK